MIQKFISSESAGGIIMILAAVLALVFANSPLDHYYHMLLSTVAEVRVGDYGIKKPLLLWINDGLMAIFFFFVGLELKYELMKGVLSDRRTIVLPAVGAVGGMFVPAAVYVLFNWDNPVALQGWAIPAATDIAFALAILSLLGSRVPVTLKIFLTSLAIFDDIGAIIIIALFYTSNISLGALIVTALCIAVLALLNRTGVTSKGIYIAVGLVMWAATLKSGVHATLAGVVLAMFIPMSKNSDHKLVLKSLEHDLRPVVAFIVLPVFAFANAGISFAGVGAEQLLHSVSLGIAAGLVVGKQLGIFGFCWLALKTKVATLPDGMNYGSLYGTAALCGVGFTMSLFIGSLAFEETGVDQFFDERLGIMLGSLISGVMGYLLLRKSLHTPGL